MSNAPRNYTGQNFNAPIIVDNDQIFTDPQIKMARTPFFLERYEFSKIIHSEGPWLSIAQMLSGAAIGLFVNMIGKFIGNKMDPKISFDMWELYSFGAALLLTAIFFVINAYVPNEKRKIVKSINEHFEHS